MSRNIFAVANIKCGAIEMEPACPQAVTSGGPCLATSRSQTQFGNALGFRNSVSLPPKQQSCQGLGIPKQSLGTRRNERMPAEPGRLASSGGALDPPGRRLLLRQTRIVGRIHVFDLERPHGVDLHDASALGPAE